MYDNLWLVWGNRRSERNMAGSIKNGYMII